MTTTAVCKDTRHLYVCLEHTNDSSTLKVVVLSVLRQSVVICLCAQLTPLHIFCDHNSKNKPLLYINP